MTAALRSVGGGGAARFAGPALALVVCAAAGCGGGDGYEPSLRFPPRADRLVLRTPPAAPTKPADPGKLDDAIAGFDAAGGQTLDPATVPADLSTEVAAAVGQFFGTPASPGASVPGADTSGLPLDPRTLARGSVLYRRSCAQCHGLTGDGRGPSGPWLYPHPRDFRQGWFKASANTPGGKLRLDDLKRVIRYGVPGTSMPVFDLLPGADVDALAGYVVFLAVRGETEFRGLRFAVEDAAGDVPEEAAKAIRQWQQAQASTAPIPAIPQEPDADAVRRGHELFVGTAGCVGCHADYGRSEQYRYDVWGAAGRVPDLTRGEHRWGKTPDDLARRVKYGIPAAGMPANPGLSDDQVRDLAAFLRDLPAPPRLPDDVRRRVYP